MMHLICAFSIFSSMEECMWLETTCMRYSLEDLGILLHNKDHSALESLDIAS
jgi:hypothetical protein